MAQSGTSIDPSYKFVAVTPSDTELLKYDGEPSKTKGIYVAVSGDLTVKNDLDDTVIFTLAAAGAVYPIATDKILSTGTTATGIVAFF